MKIIHVIPTLLNGGTERFLMNFLDVSSDDYENKIIVYDSRNYWDKKLKQLGVEVIVFGKPAEVGLIANFRECYRLFKKEHPDVVYAYTYYNAAYVLLAAMLAGVKTRILHVHTSATDHEKNLSYKMYVFLSKIILAVLPVYRLSCSIKAGKKLFYRKFEVVPNGINLKKYQYNKRHRHVIRKKLGIDKNTLVLGTVGRLDKNKNQKMMLNILSKYQERNKNVKLIIVGDGPENLNLKKEAASLGINKDVIFVGDVNNVHEYYNAFDIFLLTSYNEGFPYVLIESQANGLPVVVSSTVTSEVKINKNFEFVNLDKSILRWVKVIEAIPKDRVAVSDEMKNYSLDKLSENMKKIINRREGKC